MNTRKCGHKWEIISTWGGRYRCEWCKAVGYRKISIIEAYKTGHHIVPYVCQHRDCNQLAQVSNRDGRRKCFGHW
jgi:hypothetical protein